MRKTAAAVSFGMSSAILLTSSSVIPKVCWAAAMVPDLGTGLCSLLSAGPEADERADDGAEALPFHHRRVVSPPCL